MSQLSINEVIEGLQRRVSNGETNPFIEVYAYIYKFQSNDFFNFSLGGCRSFEPKRLRIYLTNPDRQLNRRYNHISGKDIYGLGYGKNGKLLKSRVQITVSYKPDLKLYTSAKSCLTDFYKDIEEYEDNLKSFQSRLNELKNNYKDII